MHVFWGMEKCSSKFVQPELLNKAKERTSKNRAAQGFHYINSCISNFFGPYSKTCIVKVRAAWGRVSRGLTVIETKLHQFSKFFLIVKDFGTNRNHSCHASGATTEAWLQASFLIENYCIFQHLNLAQREGMPKLESRYYWQYTYFTCLQAFLAYTYTVNFYRTIIGRLWVNHL